MATEVAPRELMARRAFRARLGPKGDLLYKLMTTTDHKLIGVTYMVACFTLFFTGGLMALLMRAELGPRSCSPGNTGWRKSMCSARRSSATASSASCANTSAT